MSSDRVPHAAEAVGALPNMRHHGSRRRRPSTARFQEKAVMQSKALIKGMIGPDLALGRRGSLMAQVDRCLKEKTLREGDSMRKLDYSTPILEDFQQVAHPIEGYSVKVFLMAF
jgi:hypothetical protein